MISVHVDADLNQIGVTKSKIEVRSRRQVNQMKLPLQIDSMIELLDWIRWFYNREISRVYHRKQIVLEIEDRSFPQMFRSQTLKRLPIYLKFPSPLKIYLWWTAPTSGSLPELIKWTNRLDNNKIRWDRKIHLTTTVLKSYDNDFKVSLIIQEHWFSEFNWSLLCHTSNFLNFHDALSLSFLRFFITLLKDARLEVLWVLSLVID